MADLRETLLANAKTALEQASVTVNSSATTKPTGLNVYRHRTRGMTLDDLPDCSVFYFGERHLQEEKAPAGVSERTVTIGVQCRAKATSSQTGDEALIPVLAWAELALLADDYTVNGAAINASFGGIDPLDAKENADTVAEALVRIDYTIQTKLWDPRSSP